MRLLIPVFLALFAVPAAAQHINAPGGTWTPGGVRVVVVQGKPGQYVPFEVTVVTDGEVVDSYIIDITLGPGGSESIPVTVPYADEIIFSVDNTTWTDDVVRVIG